MPDWTCETIRLSLFSTGGVQITNEDWTNLTGQAEAEKEQKGAGRRVMASALMGGQLSLTAVGNRCDCVLSPIANVDEISEEQVPSVGQWPTCFDQFQKATEAYLPKFGIPISRIALGVTLVSLHKERLDAYKAFAQQVKSIAHPPEKLHDVLFRINWPQNSKADNTLMLNRLTTWQVQQIQLQIIVDGNSPTTFVNPITHTLRLELDHNTDQAHAQPFDRDQLVPIYRELANLALQNADQGEIQCLLSVP
jgi:hypothetical protein